MSRMWVVGAGPSIRRTPLDLLHDMGEHTFAMNRCYLMWQNGHVQRWRPTQYLKVDYNPFHKDFWKEEVYAVARLGIPMYLWSEFKDGYDEHHPNFEDMPDGGVGDLHGAIWIERCAEHHYYRGNNLEKRPESWHLPELCTFGTGLSTMMQLAALQGYDEIYLLGTDLGYGPDYTANFFDPEYCHDLRGERAEQDNIDQGWAHEVAARSSPIPIYNASLGGELEAHKRVNFWDVISG